MSVAVVYLAEVLDAEPDLVGEAYRRIRRELVNRRPGNLPRDLEALDDEELARWLDVSSAAVRAHVRTRRR